MGNLIVCCDGTWNTPGDKEGVVPSPTNVVKLYNALAAADAGGAEQQRYYHPGVGTEGGLLGRLAGGGLGEGLDQNIMSAYFTNGKDISSNSVLVECAVSAGMDADTASTVLTENLFAQEVANQISGATGNGITAVPTYVINDQWSVPGAQDTEMFERVLVRLAEKQQ